MIPWFRFYNEVLDDPKVQRLAPDMFKVWVNMLCLASRNDGLIPPLNDVSFAFRVTPELAQEFVSRLIDCGLIDKGRNGVLKPHQWDSRQFKSDTSTERVKRFRKRSKTVTETVNETDQNRTEQNREEPPIVPPRGTTYTPAFEEFWKSYPRPVGKGAAFRAWKNAKPNPQILTAMVAAITVQKKSDQWTKDNGQFIPHPATWINQRRWEDEPARPEARVRSVHDYL